MESRITSKLFSFFHSPVPPLSTRLTLLLCESNQWSVDVIGNKMTAARRWQSTARNGSYSMQSVVYRHFMLWLTAITLTYFLHHTLFIPFTYISFTFVLHFWMSLTLLWLLSCVSNCALLVQTTFIHLFSFCFWCKKKNSLNEQRRNKTLQMETWKCTKFDLTYGSRKRQCRRIRAFHWSNVKKQLNGAIYFLMTWLSSLTKKNQNQKSISNDYRARYSFEVDSARWQAAAISSVTLDLRHRKLFHSI